MVHADDEGRLLDRLSLLGLEGEERH
jgi:hypothetical protein